MNAHRRTRLRRLALILTPLLALSAGWLWLAARPATAPDAAAAVPHRADPATRRTVREGELVGFADAHDTYGWVGIPFAAPPLGELRWRAPRPPAAWQGLREALVPQPPCPQLANVASGVTGAEPGTVVGSEDCLYLNLWAPRSTPRALPVMVWIHGGGNTMGTASTFTTVSSLAGPGQVVVVTVNYRLGPLGWFTHPALREATPGAAETQAAEDASGNYGTLDLIAALRWVRDNISAFGGDPNNVTVFGESAGGVNVYALLVVPAARDLFHRAIIQSGLPVSHSVERAAAYTEDSPARRPRTSRELVNRLLVAAGRAADRATARAQQEAMDASALRAWLRARSPAELLAPFAHQAGALAAMYAWPAQIADGFVLPKDPILEVLRDPARHHAVPVIVGTNRDEAKLFQFLDPRYVELWFGKIPRIRDVSAYERDAALVSAFWKAVGADEPASRLRAAQGPNVFVYRFDWDEAPRGWLLDLGTLLGAAHGFDVGFLLGEGGDLLRLFGAATAENAPGRRELADAMRSYWTQFAYTGSPGQGREGKLPQWAPWDEAGTPPGAFLALDTGADRGIRMLRGRITIADLKRRLLADESLAAERRERCRLYVAMFLPFAELTGGWDQREYERFGREGCGDFPPASLLPAL